MARLIDCLDMTIAVDWDVRPQRNQNKINNQLIDFNQMHIALRMNYSWLHFSDIDPIFNVTSGL